MQMKKFMAGALGLVMTGATLGFAQSTGMAQYPTPFIGSDGSAQFLVVVGAVAQTDDVVGSIDLATRLGGEATTNVNIPGATSTATVSGEGKSLFTENEKIYLADNLYKTGLRTAMSDTDLPTLLKSGVVEDTDANANYDYDQFIDFSNDFEMKFTKIGNDVPDPVYLFGEFPTSPTTTNYLYRTRLIFNDEVNNATVIGEKIKIFGGTYTFGAGTTSTKIVLQGGSDSRTLVAGETVSVTIDGVPHEVTLVGTSSSTEAAIKVDGSTDTVTAGQTKTIAGIQIYLDKVILHSTLERQLSQVTVGIGARTLTFDDTKKVELQIAGNTENIDGTYADVIPSGTKLTGLDVYVGATDSKTDFLKAGGEFVDPVWTTFKMAFPSISTGMTDDSRDKIEISASGSRDMELAFTNDRGYEGTLKFAHTDTSSDTTALLADADNDTIVVVENGTIKLNGYFIVDSGDFSRMFEITSLDADGSSNADMDLQDVFSGNTIKVTFSTDNADSKIIDGQTYYFTAPTTTAVQVTWGTSAANGTVGDFLTVWPKLKTRDGARVALTQPTTVTSIANTSTVLELPTGAITITWGQYDNITAITAATTEDSKSTVQNTTIGVTTGVSAPNNDIIIQVGRTANAGAWYNITNLGYNNETGKGNVTISPASSSTVGISTPAVMLIEEEDDNNDMSVVLVDVGTELRGSNYEVSVGSVNMYNRWSSASLDSNSDVTSYVDFWGTYAQETVTDQDKVNIWYPDNQVSANVFILAKDATVSTSGSVAGQTVKSAVPIKTPVAKLDSEVTSADKSTKNLVLVGGPVVNTLVAELATAGKTHDTQWYRDQGTGTALIDWVTDGFATGKAALVVAGYEAGDTRTVTGYLQNFDAHKSEFTGKTRVVYKNGVLTTTTA